MAARRELVSGTARAAQAQPVEAQDAFEVRELHLDLLAISPRLRVGLGAGQRSRDVACGPS